MASPETIVRVLLEIGEYLGQVLSEARQVWYIEGLADLDDAILRTLPRQVRLTWRYPSMPLIADLREMAGAGQAPEDTAERAWQAWRRAARMGGAYRSLVCQDGALAATLEAVFGGWPEACSISLSDEMWTAKRKEWGRCYRVFAGERQPRHLPGLHERDNAGRGLSAPTPVALIEQDGHVRTLTCGPGESPLAMLGAGSPRPALPAHGEPIGREEARTLWGRLRAAVALRQEGKTA